MGLIGQAIRDGFKDLIIRLIERRIQTTYNLEVKTELLHLKREIMELDTE